jgi:catechol 2,3-dioxygenase-like lactoylglutathione lyase family enzyme
MARARRKKSAAGSTSGLAFNHAMIYVTRVEPAVAFYSALGFRMIEQMAAGGFAVYARLRAPRGPATIALHLLGEDIKSVAAEGIRLYFEVKNLDAFCKRLAATGIVFSKMPRHMPWGWRHAYLSDPDGHEVSLYWAGAKRLQKSKMK